jgi:cobalt-zinc-cadmium efflux system protein
MSVHSHSGHTHPHGEDHAHGHAHHGHGHGYGPRVAKEDRQRLAIVLALTAAFMVVEAVAGYMTRSLALLSDAAHMLSDVAALSLALFAIWFAERPANPQKTFGYYRVEILAALANGVTLVVIAIGIFVEAWERLWRPETVDSEPMLIVGILGLLVNIIGALLLARSHGHNLNLRGAFLHILGDLCGSVGAIAAAGIIMATGWERADPLVSILIGVLILFSAWTLCRDTINVLLEGTPIGLAFEEVEAAMRGVPGVMAVGDLHLWSLTSGIDALSAHVAVEEGADPSRVLCDLEEVLRDRFRLTHTTIQLEGPGLPQCPFQR